SERIGEHAPVGARNRRIQGQAIAVVARHRVGEAHETVEVVAEALAEDREFHSPPRGDCCFFETGRRHGIIPMQEPIHGAHSQRKTTTSDEARTPYETETRLTRVILKT